MKTFGVYLLGLLILLFIPIILILIGIAVNTDFLTFLLNHIEPGIGITFFTLAILIVFPSFFINKVLSSPMKKK